jgi:hypothetical protein
MPRELDICDVELGHGAHVAEIAATVRRAITRSRRAAFWIDYGRSLFAERKTRERGLVPCCAATSAPQQMRNNVFLQEAVSGLLAAARRDRGVGNCFAC